jgi:GAF domain-containing protein/anti-anti-sigma regulatory factor
MTSLQVSGDAAVVRVSGFLDGAALQPCRAALDQAIRARSAVVLDVEGAEVHESDTPALLGAVRRYVLARRATLTLVGACPSLLALLERVGVRGLFDVAHDVAATDRPRGDRTGHATVPGPSRSPRAGAHPGPGLGWRSSWPTAPMRPGGAGRMVMGMAETDDAAMASLQAGLEGLAIILLESRPLVETLTHVARFAAAAVPGADGVGLTVLEASRPDIMAASTDFVTAVDEAQYGLGEGPCIDVVEIRRPLVSGSLGGERRWPRFGPRAGRMGVHSVLSLPLIVADDVVGALSVYGRSRDSFSADAVRIGQRFAVPASVTVANARLLEQSRRLALQLEQALSSRRVIDQAIGILMSRGGVTAEAAFDRLRAISQGEGTKVSEVAATVVDQAVSRARARRQAP